MHGRVTKSGHSGLKTNAKGPDLDDVVQHGCIPNLIMVVTVKTGHRMRHDAMRNSYRVISAVYSSGRKDLGKIFFDAPKFSRDRRAWV